MKAQIKINKWINLRVKSTASGVCKIKQVGQRLGTVAIVTDSDKLVSCYEILLDKGLKPKVVKL